MNPKELILIAQQEEIDIEPTITLPVLHLFERDIKNIEPLKIIKVPIFVALAMKKSNMCKIRLPNFLYEEFLEETKKNEVENSKEYCQIHPKLFELGEILIDHCYNVENRDRIKLLIQEIREIRFAKTKDGLKGIDGHAYSVNNLTSWEFNEVRGFMLKGNEFIRKFL